MKKSLTVVVLLIITILIVSSCARDNKAKSLILTSIYPYELLLKDMVGSDITVQSIIPPNASPHTWSPNPADLRAVDNADLIVVNGLDLENVIAKALAANKEKTVVLAELAKIDPLKDEDNDDGKHLSEHEAEHEAGHHHERDPHIWTSPRNMIRMANALLPVLTQKFPAYKDSINARTTKLITALTALDKKIAEEIKVLPQGGIITYHNSFGYFFADYSISNPASVQSSPGKEPTPRELNELGKIIREQQIGAVFIEPQMSRKSADILAREFRLNVLSLDPMGTSLSASGITDMISKNWEAIKQGMNKK